MEFCAVFEKPTKSEQEQLVCRFRSQLNSLVAPYESSTIFSGFMVTVDVVIVMMDTASP